MNIPSNKIQQAYLESDPEIQPFVRQDLKPDWQKLSRSLEGQAQHRHFLDELISQNKPAGHEAVQKNCRLLEDRNTVIIITGQQMGLFVSPLYTIYKTLTTIKMAARLNVSQTDINYVPVFWLEGEDHDYAEVNHARIWKTDGMVEKLVLPEIGEQYLMSMNKHTLGPEIEKLLAGLEEQLLESEFSPTLHSQLKEIYRAGDSWTVAFKKQMQLMFDAFGLLYFNPGTETVKKLSVPFFEELILKNESLVKDFTDQSAALSAAGFQNQVSVDSGRSYIFYSHDNGPRRHLRKTGDGQFALKNHAGWDKESLRESLYQNPQWFSSTVLTRPLWQSWMLPVASYVAGPAEIAYWAQLGTAFDSFGISMPHLQPRSSFTMVEPKPARLLKKLDIGLEDILPKKADFIKSFFKSEQASDLNSLFENFSDGVNALQQKVSARTESIDQTLLSAVEKSFANIVSTGDKLKNRLIRRIEEKETLLINQLHTLHAAIYPQDNLQERQVSSVYFLNKYGPAWLEKVYDELDIDKPAHKVVSL